MHKNLTRSKEFAEVDPHNVKDQAEQLQIPHNPD